MAGLALSAVTRFKIAKVPEIAARDEERETYVTTAVLAGWVVIWVKVCCGRVLVAVMYAVEPWTLVYATIAVLAGCVEIVN